MVDAVRHIFFLKQEGSVSDLPLLVRILYTEGLL